MKTDFYLFIQKTLNILGVISLAVGVVWTAICVVDPFKYGHETTSAVGTFVGGLFFSFMGQVMVVLSRIYSSINQE
jgi:hypothetical protein